MNAQPYTPSDYPALCALWAPHGFAPIPEALLPSTGFIVPGLAAGFMYTMDAPIAWLAWLTVEKTAHAKMKWQALDLVIDSLCNEARRRGCRLVFAETNNFVLGGRYLSHGFQPGDRKASQYFRGL